MSLSRADRAECGGVVLTGCANLLADQLLPRAVFIGVVALCWIGWVSWRWRREPGLAARQGLRRKGLGPAARATLWLVVAAGCAMAAVGAARGNLTLHWHMLPLLGLYPLWGLVQQFLVQSLVARHLAAAGWSAPAECVMAGMLFGLVHLPDVELALGTTMLGMAATCIYLRHRNLWPLALAHGWLAVPMYFFVRGENPWLALIGGMPAH